MTTVEMTTNNSPPTPDVPRELILPENAEIKAQPRIVSEDNTDTSGFIIEGKRGDLQDVLGPYFEENKGAANTAGKMLAMVGCCLTGVGCLYLTGKHILIPDGYIGMSLNNGNPEMHGPGRHVLVSCLNGDMKLFKTTIKHIQYHTWNIITVNEDEYGLAFEQGKPIVLGPGVHIQTSPYFQFVRFAQQQQKYINHGTFHRLIVKMGYRALGWEGNQPLLFGEGLFHRISPLFEYIGEARIDQELVELAPYTIVTVDDGRVGVAFDRGILRIMGPGEHWLDAEQNQKFVDFLNTNQMVKQLKKLEILTTDGLMVSIIGSITFSITNPELAVSNIGGEFDNIDYGKSGALSKSIFNTIMRRANDTLASLLTGSEILSSAGMGFASSTISAIEQPGGVGLTDPDKIYHENKEDDDKQTAELNQVIQHKFKSKLTSELSSQWGVSLYEMNVIDIQVNNDNIRNALAEGVRSNIVTVTDRRTAESKAETLRILAKGESDAAKIKTDGEAYGILELAKAQQEAGKLLEQTPVAVEIRLAETAAKAIGESKSSLVISEDMSSRSLMKMLGIFQESNKNNKT